MPSVNLMVSDTIKIPMNNTMKRLEMLLKGHPKMSEDTMIRFRKVRTLSISLAARTFFFLQRSNAQRWEDSIVDKLYPMKGKRMNVVEKNSSADVIIQARTVVSSARKGPLAKTKRRRKGTFSKFYSKPNERSLRLIRKRKKEALRGEQEKCKVSGAEEDGEEKKEEEEQEKMIERQRLLEMSGLNQVTVSISSSNTTSTELEPGEEISTNIGMDLLGGDLDALEDLQISEADIDLLEEEEEDDSELLLKETYKGSNVMVSQVVGKCQNDMNSDSHLRFRLKNGVANVNGETFLIREATCVLKR